MNVRDPSTLFLAWIVVPALVVVASAGLGHGLALIAGRPLGTLTVPAGFLGGVTLVTLFLSIGLTGTIAVVLTALCAVSGWVGVVRRSGIGPPKLSAAAVWPGVAAAVTYLMAMAPLIGSGRSGVLGYVLNNDSAVHVVIVEWLVGHGADPAPAPRDSFEATTGDLAAGYPLGSYAWPLFGRVLTGVGTFHLWSPMSAISMAMLALIVFAVLRTLDAPRAGAAAGAVLAASGHLVYAYHAQGGAKEVLMPVAVYGAVALAAQALAAGRIGWRSLLPAVVGVIAAVANLGYAAAAWVGAAALAVLVVLVWRAWRARSAGELVAVLPFLAITLAGAVLVALQSSQFLSNASGDIEDPKEVGNLLGAIQLRQAFNVWLAYDYRIDPADAPVPTDIGFALALAFGIAGLIYALLRRNVVLPVCVIAGVAGVMVIGPRASIYYEAKALVVLAPAVGMATAVGVVAVTRLRLPGRLVGGAGALLLAAAVVVSDAYTYAGVWVTPRTRLEQLASVESRFAGQGPILVNDREHYATYVLRDAQPWVEWGFRFPQRGFRFPDNLPAQVPRTPDFDQYQSAHIQNFPLLLERKHPGASLPPSNFSKAFETRDYEVFERTGPGPSAHVPYGALGMDGSAPLRCTRGRPRDRAVRGLVRQARRTNRPVVVAVDDTPPVAAVQASNWAGSDELVVLPPPGQAAIRGGGAAGEVHLEAANYDAWVQGSFGPGVELYVRTKGQESFLFVGAASADLGLPDQWVRIQLVKSQGRTLTELLAAERSWYKAGSRHHQIVGPLVLEPRGKRRGTLRVPADRLRSLCGRMVDWLELPSS